MLITCKVKNRSNIHVCTICTWKSKNNQIKRTTSYGVLICHHLHWERPTLLNIKLVNIHVIYYWKLRYHNYFEHQTLTAWKSSSSMHVSNTIRYINGPELPPRWETKTLHWIDKPKKKNFKINCNMPYESNQKTNSLRWLY